MSQQENSPKEEEEKPKKVWGIHKDKGKCEILGDAPASYKTKSIVVQLESGLKERLPVDEFTTLDYDAPPCEEHPKYKAMRKPRSGCETCMKAYKEAKS